MRRRSTKPKPGQLGGFWLSKRAGSPFWHRTWYDHGTRQTRRESLDRPGIDATDFAVAELELAAYVISTQRPKNAPPAEVLLSVVMASYLTEHAPKTASFNQAKLYIGYFNTFWPGKTVAEITPPEQDRYEAKRLKDGVDKSSIAREFTVLRATIRRAARKHELASAPYIKYVETKDDLRADEPKGRPLAIEEVAALFNAARTYRTRLFLIILANTMCRPGAALDLTKFQADFGHKLVRLNPPGRKQTKKHRPIVPMTDTLRVWLKTAPGDRYLAYGTKAGKSAKHLWRLLRAGAGLDGDVNGYSLRHTMSRELRKRRVPAEQIKLMLGHQLPDETTQIYAPYDPDYCREAAAAIDAYMADLQKLVSLPIVGLQVVGPKSSAVPQ